MAKVKIQYTVTATKEIDIPDIPEGAEVQVLSINGKPVAQGDLEAQLQALAQVLESSNFKSVKIKGTEVPITALVQGVPLILNLLRGGLALAAKLGG